MKFARTILPTGDRGHRRRLGRAFSLIELLVVIAAIGLLTAIGLPALRGIGEGNSMRAAVRQVLDDLALARLVALNNRATVSMVFLPPMQPSLLNDYRFNTNAHQTLRNSFEGMMASYAIVAERTVGDQPGQHNDRYVRLWRRLPEGIVFAPWSFLSYPQAVQAGIPMTLLSEWHFPFRYRTDIPFPIKPEAGTGPGVPPYPVPCITYNPAGQLFDLQDRIITLMPGSVLVGLDQNGLPNSVDFPPAQRSESDMHEETYIRVSGLTGRASVEPKVMRP